jgi:hypothetical protein
MRLAAGQPPPPASPAALSRARAHRAACHAALHMLHHFLSLQLSPLTQCQSIILDLELLLLAARAMKPAWSAHT